MAAKLKLASETPQWWSPRGRNMHISITGTVLTGEKADLALQSTSSTPVFVRINQVFRRDKYTIKWHVSHSGGLDCPHSTGVVETNSLEIRRMFVLDDAVEDPDAWMLKRYGGTTAAQGKFLRQDRYLNISGPGTGHDGDANISIFVSEGIQVAVQSLLKQNGHLPA